MPGALCDADMVVAHAQWGNGLQYHLYISGGGKVVAAWLGFEPVISESLWSPGYIPSRGVMLWYIYVPAP